MARPVYFSSFHYTLKSKHFNRLFKSEFLFVFPMCQRWGNCIKHPSLLHRTICFCYEGKTMESHWMPILFMKLYTLDYCLSAPCYSVHLQIMPTPQLCVQWCLQNTFQMLLIATFGDYLLLIIVALPGSMVWKINYPFKERGDLEFAFGNLGWFLQI